VPSVQIIRNRSLRKPVGRKIATQNKETEYDYSKKGWMGGGYTTALAARAALISFTSPAAAARPAAGVNIIRPGHQDTFTADDNYIWLYPGESQTIKVSTVHGLKLSGRKAVFGKLNMEIVT